MKSNLLKSLKLTLAFCVFFSVFYIFILWVVAKMAGRGMESGCRNFEWKKSLVRRMSVRILLRIFIFGDVLPVPVMVEASSSAGSNKGPTNPEYLTEVEARIDTFLVKHPYLQRAEVPAEMVTASGSGLDPEISKMGAYVQIKRVAAARGLSEEQVKAIVDEQVKGPFLGLFGPGDRVNVLKLNVALDEARKTAENR